MTILVDDKNRSIVDSRVMENRKLRKLAKDNRLRNTYVNENKRTNQF